MVNILKRRIRLEPAQVLVMGFAIVIMIGTGLLMLPIASADGSGASLLDAAFTSTSAVCVTGLVVRDTGTSWTYFGQIVILFLIQIGGLGFMTMATIILMLLGRRITLRDRLVIQEALNELSLQGLVRLILRIVAVTVLFELIGVMMFSMRFIPAYGFGQGLYMSIFLSVSAFCNAGFDVVGSVVAPFSSFVPYRSDIVINFTTMLLVIIGGLGFTVLLEIGRVKKFKRMSLHTKFVLVITGILLLFGTIIFFVVEIGNPATLGDPDMPIHVKVMSALFQSVTTRTAGFNTIDQNSLTVPGKLLSQILMFIGASPGGTGGGMKTTTMALVFLMVLSVTQGHDNITIFKRRIPRGTALELIKRGHRLVADDAVEITRIGRNNLVGRAPQTVRHFMELRGIGIIDVERMYGISAVLERKTIGLVIEMERWIEGKAYDRLGMDNEYISIMGVRLPQITVPVAPGRNLAIIMEAAARNYRLKNEGYNAVEELTRLLISEE